MPTAQFEQADKPAEAEYVPAEQLVQTLASVAE